MSDEVGGAILVTLRVKMEAAVGIEDDGRLNAQIRVGDVSVVSMAPDFSDETASVVSFFWELQVHNYDGTWSTWVHRQFDSNDDAFAYVALRKDLDRFRAVRYSADRVVDQNGANI